MAGGSGNDLMFGEAGDDAIDGGLGNDALVGNEGNDFLSGSDGNDFLYGELGLDYLSGGFGSDTFVITSSTPEPFAYDVITDFSSSDRIIIQQSRFGVVSKDQFTFASNFLYYDPVIADGIQPVVQLAYILPPPVLGFSLNDNLIIS